MAVKKTRPETKTPQLSEEVWDAIVKIPNSLKSIARAILPDAAGGSDASGSHVDSLTEAVMGVTAGLVSIAEALNNVADALRSHRTSDS